MDVRRIILEQEIGTVYKIGTRFNAVLLYPNSYYVGMSNLGFHTIYYELNRRDDTTCERAFFSPSTQPSPARGEGAERNGFKTRPWNTVTSSLEHNTPLSDF